LHNCRTRHKRGMAPERLGRSRAEHPLWADRETSLKVARVVSHYNSADRDLLDIVIRHGHAAGLSVYGSLRLNNAAVPIWMEGVPGPDHCGGMRRDFRSEAFQRFLLEILEDLLEKGVDGLSLDFERKAPFFPDDVPQAERDEATDRFLGKARKLSDKPLIVRVAHDAADGRPQGQRPLAWMADGLIDAVIPATHNHEPVPLDWDFQEFVQAAANSPRICRVWPQLWPSGELWAEAVLNPAKRHPLDVLERRAHEILSHGADGVYFFNFCCFWPTWGRSIPAYGRLFQRLTQLAAS